MAKVSVLKLEMLRTSLAFKDHLSTSAVDTILGDLNQWYNELPSQMQIASASFESDPEVTRELRRTIYFIQLLYLGAVILLARQVMQQSADQKGDHLSYVAEPKAVQAYTRQAIAAAKQSCQILNRLLLEEGVFYHCWLCM